MAISRGTSVVLFRVEVNSGFGASNLSIGQASTSVWLLRLPLSRSSSRILGPVVALKVSTKLDPIQAANRALNSSGGVDGPVG
jgi:hypothetical protein